ncbi:hypothetical protein BSKO_09573 [Bryopsis sp. KO-2023]|nr:hypothetical protein BSKO_09573 [Bryopsis sp. KO-2023]
MWFRLAFATVAAGSALLIDRCRRRRSPPSPPVGTDSDVGDRALRDGYIRRSDDVPADVQAMLREESEARTRARLPMQHLGRGNRGPPLRRDPRRFPTFRHADAENIPPTNTIMPRETEHRPERRIVHRPRNRQNLQKYHSRWIENFSDRVNDLRGSGLWPVVV